MSRTSYNDVKTALTERFEPASKRELYKAELQVRAKKQNDGCADFSEELRRLVDKAFPNLEANAHEQLALNQYLSQLHNPQVAFAVKQQYPTKLEEAVCVTLEFESYLLKPSTIGHVETESEPINNAVGQDQYPVTVVEQKTEYAQVKAINQLTQRLEQLEEATRKTDTTTQSHKFGGPPAWEFRQSQSTSSRPRIVICHRCGKRGHYARGCASCRSQGLGN